MEDLPDALPVSRQSDSGSIALNPRTPKWIEETH
jgi:hypothetical protein